MGNRLTIIKTNVPVQSRAGDGLERLFNAISPYAEGAKKRGNKTPGYDKLKRLLSNR